MEDQIKTAFQKVKQDIDSIKEEIDLLNQFLFSNQERLTKLTNTILELSSKIESGSYNPSAKFNPSYPADSSKNQTIPTHNPADNLSFKPLNSQNMGFSTGNGGVPTDRQTDRQTDQQIEKGSFNDALEVLASLDNIKKEIRNKFKRLTEQEFLVFSTIYQLSEDDSADYRSIALKLNLTESSIRDYVGRLIKKGIPIEKIKINNKMIKLSISEKLTKIAPLSIILQLREI